MTVIHVGRSKEKEKLSPIILSQGHSLTNIGVSVNYFAITGRGFIGYFKSIFKLRRYISTLKPDLVHAHYSLSGFVAAFATSKPIVVSLMGSFPKRNWRYYLVKFFMSFLWKVTIVKSAATALQLKSNKLHIIPNGVDLKLFTHLEKEDARKKCKLESNKKYILFAAEPQRKVKNYQLAESAVKLITSRKDVELLTVYNLPHDKIVEYMYASDVLLLTSISEGSPNVIKEALACNLPIVTTKVGDVERILETVEGAFIANTYDDIEVSKLLEEALKVDTFKGLDRILELNLDSESVANKLSNLYAGLF
ncbi:MAG: glycosyltransferase involved in cell wall biosynthesis [Patiriisocius sp.]|jgi:glycosyltransferase involved in cell wall biosynthesis